MAASRAPAQDIDFTNEPPPSREMSVALFNHKDFSGWTFFMTNRADPPKTWSITNGVIHCTGTPIGYLRTVHAYSNYFLTVIWRYVKISPRADNTGILVQIQPGDKIWPCCVQVEGKHNRHGDLLLMDGAECKEHRGKNAGTPVAFQDDSVENPVGEWNKTEIICNKGKVVVFINGRFMNEISECTINSGFIGIQSEGGEIEIRSIDYSPL